MYPVDDLDEVVELTGLPQCDVGAPLPVVVVTFDQPSAHSFGPPNDEAFEGHPLAARGLGPYGAYKVVNSSWNVILAGWRPVSDADSGGDG